eukprot:gene16697-19850_t
MSELVYKTSCALFEKQLWRKDRCKHCFKTEPEHSLVSKKFGGSPRDTSQVVPSVDKAPLSIRRTLTPQAIETFNRRISQSPPASPTNKREREISNLVPKTPPPQQPQPASSKPLPVMNPLILSPPSTPVGAGESLKGKLTTPPSSYSRSYSRSSSNASEDSELETKPKSSSFFIPRMSEVAPDSPAPSSPLPIYQQKHVRTTSSGSASPAMSSSPALLSSSPHGSPRVLPALLSARKQTIAKGLIKLKRVNDLKKSDMNMKRTNIANMTDSHSEMFKLFNAISGIMMALPGISPNVVASIMDILYSQQLDMDLHTHVITPYYDGLTSAVTMLGTWIEAQEHVRDVVRVQSCVRRFLAKRRTAWLSQVYRASMLRERNTAVRHLVHEERRYVDALATIVRYYHRPLKSAALIDDADFRAIFSTVEDIHTVHTRILAQFEALYDKWPCVEGLGDIFLRIAPELKVYGSYVKNFKNAIDTLARCQNDNPKFAAFIDECCASTPGRVYDLMALIATPLNHLSMYQRQLFAIANHTPPTWPDYDNIINSVTMMKEVEQLVQDNLAQAQNEATLINIYRKMNNKKALDPFVIPGRLYLHEGKLTKFEVKKQDQIYYYFLCNDILLFTKKYQKDLLKFKNIFNLSDTIVSDQPDAANHKNIITIKKKGDSSKDTYSFAVDDAEEKRELLKQFGELCTTTVNKKLFGASIVELASREGPTVTVPSFVIKSGNFLLNQGLFRVSPNQLDVDSLKESLNMCPVKDLDNVIGKSGPHQLAAVLKAFFRDMAPPLLTHDLFDRIVDLADAECTVTDKIAQLRTLLARIPACNQATLQTVVLLLRTVGQNSERNKMSYSNLAIVFGPNLIKPAHQTIETSLKIPLINNMITLMLDNYSLLYQGNVSHPPTSHPILHGLRRTTILHHTLFDQSGFLIHFYTPPHTPIKSYALRTPPLTHPITSSMAYTDRLNHVRVVDSKFSYHVKQHLIFVILILLIAATRYTTEASSHIFKDKVDPAFYDAGWGVRDFQASKPTYSGELSIALHTDRFGGLYFYPSTDNFTFEKNQTISFFVNVGNYTDVPVYVLLTKKDQSSSERVFPLVDAVNPARSALKLAKMPAATWVNVRIPVSSFGGATYCGLMIKCGQYKPATIHIDEIQILNGNEAPTQVSATYAKIAANMVQSKTQQNCLRQTDATLEGSSREFFAKILEPAKPFYTMDPLEHSFFTNQSTFFGGGPQWLFLKRMGRIYFYGNGDIKVSGPIIAKDATTINPESWWVNLLFTKVERPGPMHIKKELPEDYYTPRGRINTDFWGYYMPVIAESYFEGLGINTGRRLDVSGVDMEMPLMIGEGASGKNVDTGMSVWLTFANPGGEHIVMDLNVNIVDMPPIKRTIYPEQICHNDSVAIGLQVFFDSNNDGEKDETEVGVPEVVITLADLKGNQIYDASGKYVPPIHSDIDGYYYFDKIPFGKYRITYAYDRPLQSGKIRASTPPPSNRMSDIIDLSRNHPNAVHVSQGSFPVQSCSIIPTFNLNLSI